MRNDDKIKYWFTTEKGVHVPVREGQSKEEALKERFSEPKFEKVGLLDGMGEHDELPKERGRSPKKKEEQFFGESDFIEVDTDTFLNALAEAKATVDPAKAWRVSSPDRAEFDEEHPNAKKYTTPGGSTVAITPDGDIVALCRNENDKQVYGKQLIEFAVKNGGNKLDAYSGLWKFYSKNGFEPVSWTPFNEKYAPSNWNKGRDEPELVIFWKYTGNTTEYLNSDDFFTKVRASDDYDTARKVRDKNMKSEVKI